MGFSREVIELTDLEKTEIYTKYKDKVLGYIWNRVNNTTLAEDICSEVFVKVYEKLDTFDEKKASVSTWIFTIMKNTLTDYYRKRRVFDEIPEDLADDSSIEDDVCNGDMLERLAEALKQLPERERDIVIFRYYRGMKLVDIAERMSISYAYVKILHKKALEALRNLIGEDTEFI